MARERRLDALVTYMRSPSGMCTWLMPAVLSADGMSRPIEWHCSITRYGVPTGGTASDREDFGWVVNASPTVNTGSGAGG